MTEPGRPQSAGPHPTRLFTIATIVIVMVIGLYIAAPRNPTAPGATAPAAAPAATQDPIPAEADVFRAKWGMVAAEPDEQARPEARLRSLAFYRRLRAYPGAPPRVPHGLTQEEFRTQRCKICHERGGYAARFGAYAPVTPHPEFGECLQCHVPEAMSVGVALPDRTGQVVCRQCHVDPDRKPPSLVSLDWAPLAWPALDTRAMPGGPPDIPHSLQNRGDCLACHAGPAAVRELRTRHPERGNCRQCHVTQESGEKLWLPSQRADNRPGATP